MGCWGPSTASLFFPYRRDGGDPLVLLWLCHAVAVSESRACARSPCACPVVTTPPGVISLSLSHTPTHPSFLHKELHIFLPKISLKTHFFPHIYIYIIFFVCLCVYIRRTSPFCVDLFFGEPSHSHPSFLCCRCCCLTGRLLGGSPIRPGNYLGGLAVLLSAGGMHPLCNE